MKAAKQISVAAAVAAGLFIQGGARAAQPEFTPDSNMARSQVPDPYKWNLAPLFASDAAFEAGLARAAEERAKFDAFKGKLAQPKALRECLDFYFQQRLITNHLTLYAQLRLVEDVRSTAAQAMDFRALGAMRDFIGATGFIRREILALSPAEYAKAHEVEPGLARYKPYIQEFQRRKAHVLGEEAERTLALAGDNLWAEIDLNELPSDHEKTFRAALSSLQLPQVADAEGKQVQLTLTNWGQFRASPARSVRQDAADKLFGTFAKGADLYAATLSGQVANSIFYAKARGYPTALDAYMGKENVDPAVYRNLISTVRANTAPLHRYMALRKRLMGLDKLRVFDLYIPVISAPARKVTFEEARKILPEALKPLGPDYVAQLVKGLDPKSGWLDLYPSVGKDSGASCTSTYGVHPFVKMNYLNDLENLSTLAHEYGHAMHTVLAGQTQEYVTANYTMFTAEIASTFNEKLLSDYLVKQAKTKEEKLALLNVFVDRIRTTLYRQALFAEFELAIHTAAEQGTPLTSDFMRKTYGDLLKAYYGPDLAVEGDDDMEWAYIPHFYYKYYVYSYATGIASAIALAEKVQKGGAPARDAYLGMLKGGSSKPALELLKGAGVDMTKPEAITAATRAMDTMLGEMEKLLKKK